MTFTAACVQLNSGDDLTANIAAASGFIRAAAGQGARLICLPENAFLMAQAEAFHAQVFAPVDHPALAACRALAAELEAWILIGSLAVRGDNPLPRAARASLPLQGEGWGGGGMGGGEKYLNRSFLIDGKGNVAAHYDKIHMFDVSLPSGETHEESKRFAHGSKAVAADTPWGKLGMTICYDLRFPHLYRALAKRGADFLAVPAAFTRFTGEKGGWHVLARARAMETGCFVLAPAQCGEHPGGRRTYGHSLIIHPWGDVLAEAGGEPCVITAEIDPEEVARARAVMPSLRHDRDFA